MKIDNTLKYAGGASELRPRPARPEAAREGGGGAADVRLSTTTAQLQGAAGEAGINAARVADIKQAIADGRFVINSGAIADSLIDTAKELIRSQQRTA